MQERPLHARRDGAGLLVDRHDATRVHRRVAVVGVAADDLVFRVGELQSAAASELDLPEEHDLLAGMKDILEKRLIEKRRAHGARRVLQDELEDPEAGTTGGPDAAREYRAHYGRHGAGAQVFDRHER